MNITEKSFTEEINARNINEEDISKILVDTLIEKGLKISSAESCTGGLVSKKITDISGSSAVFDCGICSYSNGIKEKLLGVEKNVLDTLGAVSAETAVQMARGVKAVSGSDIAVSTTGIAGPSGGTEEKPVGLVYIGVACRNGSCFAVRALLNESGNNDRSLPAYSLSDLSFSYTVPMKTVFKSIVIGADLNNVLNARVATSGWVYSAVDEKDGFTPDKRYYQIGFIPAAPFSALAHITLKF